MERILGIIEGEEPGPLVVCIAGIHGNEQIGIHAFRNVYSAIHKHNIPFKGKLIGVAGNLKAIANNVRYLDYDMNRCWTNAIIDSIIDNTYAQGVEDEEVRALYKIIEEEIGRDYSLKVIADLHATSSEKGNFIVVEEEEADHPVIKAIKLPVVVGLEKYLKGTLLSYYHHRNCLSFAFEGGTIGTEEVYQLHTSGIWEILEKSGAITHHDHEVEDHYAKELSRISGSLPQKVEIVYRHEIHKGDAFRMLPGFHNFQPVKKDQLVAFNIHGEVRLPMEGLIFMPLYQPTGDDGFFIVKEIE